VPWKEYTPIPSILVEVFAEIEVVLEEKQDAFDKTLSMRPPPPLEVFVVGTDVLMPILSGNWI